MMRLLRAMVRLTALFGLVILGFTIFTFLAAARFDLDTRPADAIVVLSGNFVARGLFVGETRERTEAGLALALAGRAPQIVVSGGDTTAEKMAAELVTGGVAPGTVLIEREATSTLHNALFARDLLPPGTGSVIVVTHRYHLPRATASFRWAGFQRVEGHPADKVGRTDLRRALLEGLKWPVNLARAAVFSLGEALGLPRDRLLPILG